MAAARGGWSLHMDNDRLSARETDQGYTAGFNLVLAGRPAREFPLSVDRLLGRLDRWLGVEGLYAREPVEVSRSVGFGLAAFTPQDLATAGPVPGERPYACLTFLENSRQAVLLAGATAYQTTLVVGLLGTNVCEGLQRFTHELTDGVETNGWANQISEGGEPTALWRFSRQQLVRSGPFYDYTSELTWSADAQLGYATDVGVGFSWRWGVLHTPWWSFTPQHAEYVRFGTAAPLLTRDARDPEVYLWAGATLRLRAYNAVLQGQFRDSAVTVAGSDLEPLIAEGWAGVAGQLGPYAVSLSLRTRSREFGGPGARNLVWGGLMVRRAF